MPRFLPLAVFCVLLASCSNAAKPLHGTAFSPPQPAKQFALIDQNGARYVLAQPRSSFTALYFGFTHCKDVCPQTLAKLGRARTAAGLTPKQVQIVMVSVDPSRDTSPALARFFAKVGVQAVGLIAPQPHLQRVYRAYGVAVRPEKDDIGHTDYIYILDRQGRLRELLSAHTPLQDVAADLRTLTK